MRETLSPTAIVGRGAVRRILRTTVGFGLLLLLSACGGIHFPDRVSPPPSTAKPKTGQPYRIAGKWYVPREDWNYDEIGIASWYGPKFHGRRTANGEIFDMNRVSAAHRTLPLPSHVRVTNLENGRAINVRVNDRGPFARGRIIDLSRRAAQLLGFQKRGTARVRVQIIRPDGTLGNRKKAARIAGDLSRATGSGGGDAAAPALPVFVQVGAFLERENARRAKKRLSGVGEVRIEKVRAAGRTLYRVRLGPYHDLERALKALRRAFRRGYGEARLFHVDGLG